jgi:uncharacterized protein YdhG (YjbR/CyaY superfamily)
MSASPIRTYISAFPKDTQRALKEVYAAIQSAVPKDTEETVRYGIPTFRLNGNLVHFGGFQKHIGFFPGPGAIVAFKEQLAGYKTSKGAIQFPLDKPMPVTLIRRISAMRVAQQKKVVKKNKVRRKGVR